MFFFSASKENLHLLNCVLLTIKFSCAHVKKYLKTVEIVLSVEHQSPRTGYILGYSGASTSTAM